MKRIDNITIEKMMRLWEECQKWIQIYKPSCAESLLQRDSINEALPELVEKICDIVGYHKDMNDDLEA